MPKHCQKACLRLLLGAPQYAFIAPLHVLWGILMNGEKAMQRTCQFQSIDVFGRPNARKHQVCRAGNQYKASLFRPIIRQQPVALVF